MHDLHGGEWTFELLEDLWGSICYMETAYLALHVGFLALPGEGTRALIDGLCLTETASTWKVDQHKAHELSGTLDEYFGSLAFCLGSTGLVNEIASGESLTIQVPGKEVVALAIANSQHEFERFLTCHRSNCTSNI